MGYVTVCGKKKMNSQSLNDARLKAIRYIRERQIELPIFRAPMKSAGRPYGVIGFDISRREYYWGRGRRFWFLNWVTGAVTEEVE